MTRADPDEPAAYRPLHVVWLQNDTAPVARGSAASRGVDAPKSPSVVFGYSR